jgi:NaMN:DMB phosphoribosyltransferase
LVAEDETGDSIGLAELMPPVPLIATQLNFAHSRYSALQFYEKGFVKEGVGAGGAAIAASLYQNWTQADLLNQIETLLDQYSVLNSAT